MPETTETPVKPSSPAAKAIETATINKAIASTPRNTKKKLVASSGSDTDADWVKALAQGHTGSGKSFMIVGMLRLGLKVFVASTDIAGNGLKSVKDELRASGEEALLNNLSVFEFTSYDDFSTFTSRPDIIDIGGKTLWEWNPDVLVWDGVSNFQESHIWSYVMDVDSISDNPSQAREEGIQAGLVEWGQIRRCTILQIDRFMTIHSPTKKLHKLVTVLMDDGKEDKLTHDTKKGPLIIGAARSYIGPAFDYILTTQATIKPGSKAPAYSYKCDIGGTTVAKKRGAAVPDEVLQKADPKALWQFLIGKQATA